MSRWEQETARKNALVLERSKILTGIQVDPTLYSLGEMQEETFQQLVEGTRLARAAEVERQRKAEAERIERETKEAAERERIRLENERLNREAAERKEAEQAEAKRRAELHAVRKDNMQTFVESGDESHNAQYGHLTDDQYAEVVAGAQNRREARLKAEAAQELLKREAADKAAAEKAERARKHDLHCTRMAILGAEQLLTEAEVRDADSVEIYGGLTEEGFIGSLERLRARKVYQAETHRKLRELEEQAAIERNRQAKESAELSAKLKAAQLQAEKENKAAREMEAKIKAASDAALKQRLLDEEVARKLAAAPDKDRLLNYANAIRGLDIPELKSAPALATLIQQQRDKFVAWLETSVDKI